MKKKFLFLFINWTLLALLLPINLLNAFLLKGLFLIFQIFPSSSFKLLFVLSLTHISLIRCDSCFTNRSCYGISKVSTFPFLKKIFLVL